MIYETTSPVFFIGKHSHHTGTIPYVLLPPVSFKFLLNSLPVKFFPISELRQPYPSLVSIAPNIQRPLVKCNFSVLQCVTYQLCLTHFITFSFFRHVFHMASRDPFSWFLCASLAFLSQPYDLWTLDSSELSPWTCSSKLCICHYMSI